jgi:hypothetical protein
MGLKTTNDWWQRPADIYPTDQVYAVNGNSLMTQSGDRKIWSWGPEPSMTAVVEASSNLPKTKSQSVVSG